MQRRPSPPNSAPPPAQRKQRSPSHSSDPCVCNDTSLFLVDTSCLPQALFCPVAALNQSGPAKRIVADAVQATPCGHIFGLKCVLNHLLEEEKCPVCKVPLEPTDLVPCETIRSEVLALSVRCPEHANTTEAPQGKGCPWIGKLHELPAHRNSASCAVPRVKCPFCGGSFVDGSPAYEEHKNKLCPNAFVLCHRCNADMRRRELKNHMKQCTAPSPKKTVAAANRSQPASPSKTAQMVSSPSKAASPDPIVPVVELQQRPPVDTQSDERPTVLNASHVTPQKGKHTDSSPVASPSKRKPAPNTAEKKLRRATTPPAKTGSRASTDSSVTAGTVCPFAAVSISQEIAAIHKLKCPSSVQSQLRDDPAWMQHEQHMQILLAAFEKLSMRCEDLELEVTALRKQQQKFNRCLQQEHVPESAEARGPTTAGDHAISAPKPIDQSLSPTQVLPPVVVTKTPPREKAPRGSSAPPGGTSPRKGDLAPGKTSTAQRAHKSAKIPPAPAVSDQEATKERTLDVNHNRDDRSRSASSSGSDVMRRSKSSTETSTKDRAKRAARELMAMKGGSLTYADMLNAASKDTSGGGGSPRGAAKKR